MMSVGIVMAAIHGTCLPFVLVVYGTTLDEFARYSITVFCEGNTTANCTSRSTARDTLIDEVTHPTILYFCIIGLVTVISGWIQVVMFQLSAGQQVKRIRMEYFCSIMKQEIAWFDHNATGEINSRLNKYISTYIASYGLA